MSFSSLLFYIFVSFTGSTSSDSTVSEHVDLIELNHFYDRQGKHVYDQVIFFERTPDTGRFVVRAWCLVEDRETLSRRPVRDLTTGVVRVDWYDSEQKILRHLQSGLYRESWTQVDPERANKRLLDERNRTSLVQSPVRYRAYEAQIELAAERAATQASQANTLVTTTNTSPAPSIPSDSTGNAAVAANRR